MTSQINPNNIDGTYPVAGQDNSSQGFRDNFTNIKNNFQYAYDEITALQANAAQRGQTTEFADSILANVAMRGQRDVLYNLGVVSGAVTVTFGNASYQFMELGGSVVLTFAGLPTLTSRALSITLKVLVPSRLLTITWPASVAQSLSTIANTSGQVTSFTDAGYYEFILTTVNSGATWQIKETTRNRSIIQGDLTFQTVVANATANAITMTSSNVGGVAVGNITATNFFGAFTSTGNNISVTGNITANNITANTAIYGNIATPTQSGITLVGTLTSLSVSGNANVGNLTTTGMTDMCGGTMYGYQYVANAANGASTQIYSNIGWCIIAPNAVIASYTVIMPATPSDGQAIKISFANTITALTHTTGGAALKGGYTTANANVGGEWIYHSLSNTWYKAS